MVDFSRAEGSKNHRVSFLKATNAVIANMQALQADYRTHWDQLETLRKDRAAIIEDTIQLLKKNNIKPSKQLGKCDNAELNLELLQAIDTLPDSEKENIQINLVKINNRYEKIDELSHILIRLENEASRFSTKEADRDQEVEIVIGNPSKAQETTETIQAEVDDYPESAYVIEPDNSKYMEELSKNMEDISSTIENEEELASAFGTTEETKEDLEKQVEEQVNTIVEDTVVEPEVETYVEQTDECILFTMNNKNTLKKIAESVYGNESYWKELYNYASNKSKIDRKAAEKGVSVEEIVTNPTEGYLDNVTLQFPTVLVTQEEVDVE